MAFVNVSDVTALASPEGQTILAALPAYDQGQALSVGEGLRSAGHSAALVSAVLTQSRLRTKARPRLGDVVDRLILTPDGAEQATRPLVAAARASRYRGAGVTGVADLGCGIALDAVAFAMAGLSVVAVERDPATAAAAQYNVGALGLADRVQVRCEDVTALPQDFFGGDVDAVYADPARRANGRRIRNPDDWSPPLSWVLALPVDVLGAKVAPGLREVPTDVEFDVVSVGGSVVEAGLYRGALRDAAVHRRATLLPSGVTMTDLHLPDAAPPVGPVSRYLHEPDGAIIRAGLVAAVVAEIDGRLLDASIAYVTTDSDVTSAFTARYEVTDVMAFSVKRLRTLLRERGVGQVSVKKRGTAVTPEVLRHQLRLDRSGTEATTVFLTRVAGTQTMMLAQPLTES